MGTIEIIDEVYCKASRDLWPQISKLMEFEGERWKDSPLGFGKKREVSTRSFLDRRSGKFLCGFLPRVTQHLEANMGNDLGFTGAEFYLEPHKSPTLPSFEGERKEQLQLQKELAVKAVKAQRGVIKAPTGSGKTTIAMLIASMLYPKYRILFLCHTISLLTQTEEEFEKNGFRNLHVIGGGRAKGIDLEASITLSTVQTFSKIPVEDFCVAFDIVLVDEAHHCNSVDGQFGFILTHLLAPVKIGFTATLPTSKESALALEGIIGPVIGEITIQEGVDMNIMAKPRIRLIPVPYNSLFGDVRKYQELYQAAIVDSRVRNAKITTTAIEMARENSSVLIIVRDIQHGDNLVDIIRAKKAECVFVQGKTDGEMREKIKALFMEKKIQIVICTAVWREGINIPSLNCVINAAGGKSEIATLQAIGRGLRSVPGKKEIVIFDFLDPYKYLAQHAIQRIAIYVEAGWI